ncbi:hypothetical protein HDU76_003065 [Blyttiomyces sp. JEL0837]|nr:hypothetical protein HDU76_003065 [Blyttiomyces sp. JEL0837]
MKIEFYDHILKGSGTCRDGTNPFSGTDGPKVVFYVFDGVDFMSIHKSIVDLEPPFLMVPVWIQKDTVYQWEEAVQRKRAERLQMLEAELKREQEEIARLELEVNR